MTIDSKIECLFKGPLGHFDLDVAVDIPARGVTALFGPSGCGKTTVLRCIAGLHQTPTGRLIVDGEIWQDQEIFRPTHERSIGYVFQEASLFPHLTVKKNLLYGQNIKKPIDNHIFCHITDLLGLDKLLDRSPRNLSGGERQRVAIGRALFSEPKLLLMDEPLSALDKQSKEEIMPFIERLHENLQLPIIYVSHDINEIEQIADHLVLISEGRVRAFGAISRLQSDPNLPLASSNDAAVSLDGIVIAYDYNYGIATFTVQGGILHVPSESVEINSKRRLKIYASDVSLTWESMNKSSIENHIPARVIEMQEKNPFQVTAILRLGLDGSGDQILARVTCRSWETLGLGIHQSVFVQIKAVSMVGRSLL